MLLLQKTIWDHLNQQLRLSGSKMNKDDLFKAMRQRNIDEALCSGILYILQECETAVFTKAELAHDKEELLLKNKRLFLNKSGRELLRVFISHSSYRMEVLWIAAIIFKIFAEVEDEIINCPGGWIHIVTPYSL